jgi:hypothetical protein
MVRRLSVSVLEQARSEIAQMCAPHPQVVQFRIEAMKTAIALRLNWL